LQIISHRGYWKEIKEKNSVVAFKRALDGGFGIETDVRDRDGELVIAHDMANEDSWPLEDFFELVQNYKTRPTLALNIKADGLHDKLYDLLTQFKLDKYFVFDMSVPDQLGYVRNRFNVYTRISEYEEVPSFYAQSSGVWLDCFNDEWYGKQDLEKYLGDSKSVCIVSPELHKRDHTDLWRKLTEWFGKSDDKILICTDHPEEASEYFNG